MTQKFITSSIGLMATHHKFDKPKLVRAEFYRISPEKVRISVVSGESLNPVGTSEIISEQEWQDSPENPYNQSERACWALRRCGWSIGNE